MRTISLGMIFLFCSLSAAAQPAGQIQLDVPFRWTQAEGESVDREQNVAAAAGFEHLLAGERVRLFYDLDMDAFGTTESLRTWLHNGGAVATFGSERRALDVGGAVFWRANEGAWADAGFKGVNVLTSLRVQPRDSFRFAGSYAFYARSFPDRPELDQLEHFGSTRVLANLVTRTTLVGVLSAGQKSYDGRVVTMVADAPTYSDTPTASGMLRGGRGWRHGVFVPSSHVELAGEPGTRHQWTWAVRVAQSLDDRTGVWIEREERRTGGDLPPAIVWTPPLFYEDGVYDDPYVIDAKSWRAGAKHVFDSGHELSVWGSRSDRAYAGLTRADVLTRAGVEAVVPLVANQRASFDLVGRYGFFRNDSTDALESYDAHQLGLGLRVSF